MKKVKNMNKVQVVTAQPIAKTMNGAVAYDHSEDHLLEYFSKAGSLFEQRESFYGKEHENTALELFKNAWRTGKYKECMQLLMWTRDIRGQGAGNRSATRSILNWLAKTNPNWIIANVSFIPELGRWDDLFSLYKTPCEEAALALWAKAIKSGDGLACKWADRQDIKLRDFMKMSPKAFRKHLVQHTQVVETRMCCNDWGNIEYSHVPSVAIGRYNKAFFKHDKDRYDKYRKSLVKVNKDGTVELTGEVNAGAIFPHDLIRIAGSAYDEGTKRLVEGQFLSMPNLMVDSKYRIMPIIDTSSSMGVTISGSIRAVDVSIGLGLYCSDRLGKDNPFYRKVVPFATQARFISWEKEMFTDAVSRVVDGYMGSTNINSALDLILDSAKMFKVKKDDMVNCIVILSDMQFDQAVSDNKTPVNVALDRWEAAGYDRPKIIYWNLAGYTNQPATMMQKDIAMISGFSPAVLTSVLGGKDFSPLGVMKHTISKYKVNIPKE